MPALEHIDTSILEDREIFWRDHQQWLQQHGYLLRPRYRVGWVPEWKGQEITAYEREDAVPMLVSFI